MAISFTTGTINEPDAGSVGLSMAEQIRDDVVAHAAWELVEEYEPGATRWYVLKCLASASGLSADYFVILGRTLGNGDLHISFCEEYDSATHTAKYFPLEYAPAHTYDAEGRHDQTFVLGSDNLAGGTANSPAMTYWTPSGTSAKWWLTVAEDGFSVGFGGAAVGFFHVGAYHYLGLLTNDLPIQLIGGWSGVGYIARNPAIAGFALSGNYAGALKFYGGGGSNPAAYPTLGFQGPWSYDDKLQSDQRPVSEIGMKIYGSDYGTYADYPTIIGFALGKQKRIRQSYMNWPAGIAFGDAFALNGTLWVPYNVTTEDGRIWDTGVAS